MSSWCILIKTEYVNVVFVIKKVVYGSLVFFFFKYNILKKHLMIN